MYTVYMALHITNPDVEKAVRKLAGLTGETVTDAIGVAAAERVARIEPAASSEPTPSFEEMMEIIRSYNLQPINEDLTEDEILGYGPDGIPE
ncbi:MAG: type II toxin-antitoxin system VapB family antitoxin [Edaphobacter sp.]